jgi:hypothetical protein
VSVSGASVDGVELVCANNWTTEQIKKTEIADLIRILENTSNLLALRKNSIWGKSYNGEALDAVHKFLRFQIEDHHTGDTLKVPAL